MYLVDNFQYQSPFVDTDYIIRRDQREKMTNITDKML